MRKLPRPAIAPEDALATCISKLRSKDLKCRLAAASHLVVAAAQDFCHRAETATLHEIPRDAPIGLVSASEMATLYDRSMAQQKCSGRKIYDALKASAGNGRCPLCGQRDVSTLDHHLPKIRYPALAVAPLNLIPACKDCNMSKGERFPTCPEDHTLHPYFDDVDTEIWLVAEVIPGPGVAVTFVPSPPAAWPALISNRVRRHFDMFKLNALYASHAADCLRMLEKRLPRLFNAGGAAAVQAHLAEEADAWRAINQNCWEAALYSALQSSNWYCSGGFRPAI